MTRSPSASRMTKGERLRLGRLSCEEAGERVRPLVLTNDVSGLGLTKDPSIYA